MNGRMISSNFHKLAPFLTGTYFVVFLAAVNVGEDIKAIDIFAALVVLWLITLLASLLPVVILRDRRSAVPLLTLGVAAAFIYPYFLEFLLEKEVIVGSQIRFFILYVLIFTGLMGYLRWKRISGARVLKILSYLIMALILVNVAQIAIGPDKSEYVPDSKLIDHFVSTADASSNRPDVYYLMFDMYGTSRTLSEYYEYDNSSFTESMNDLGFIELEDSRSNYAWTTQSIPSMLNMIHLANPDGTKVVDDDTYTGSLVSRSPDVSNTNIGVIFSELGYSTKTLHTSATRTGEGFTVADTVLSPFSDQMLDTTIFRQFRVRLNRWWKFGFGYHNFDDNFTVENILNTEDQPTFTYVYSGPPHMPFIYDSNGEITGGPASTKLIETNQDLYREGYRNSVSFVNSKLLEVMAELIERSPTPPIIIIQGDHGPAVLADGPLAAVEDPSVELLEERFGIMNMMYIPEQCSISPPNDMTSVNTFRFVLASCYESPLDMLTNDIFWGQGDQLEPVGHLIPRQ
jgi:hypothetical protein